MEVTDYNLFANPKGEEGVELTSHMNEHHRELTEWGLQNLFVTEEDSVLDIGCGGGLNISLLSKTAGNLTGIDISPVCVEATKRNNQKLVDDGKLTVVQGTAEKLPFADKSFSIVTAVETIYFWDNIIVCFNEINRVLKDGGTFMILVETYACEGRREYNLDLQSKIDNFNIYSPDQLEIYLQSAGFSDAMVIMHPDNYWMVIYATK